MNAESHEGSKSTQGRSSTDTNMNAGSREGAKGNMNTEGRSGRYGAGTDTNAGTDPNGGGRAGAPNNTVGQAGAGAKLSTDQRSQITTVIREERVAPVSHANFSVSVGTRIPRQGVELHTLPSRVATIYPEWRQCPPFSLGSSHS